MSASRVVFLLLWLAPAGLASEVVLPLGGSGPGGGGTAFGFAGNVDYLGITYTITGGQDCEEYTASTQQFIGPCTAFFQSAANGFLTLTLRPCTEFEGHCLIGDVALLLEGWAQITSVSFGQRPTVYNGYTFDSYYSNGTFDIFPAPEAASYRLITFGLFLLLGAKVVEVLRCEHARP